MAVWPSSIFEQGWKLWSCHHHYHQVHSSGWLRTRWRWSACHYAVEKNYCQGELVQTRQQRFRRDKLWKNTNYFGNFTIHNMPKRSSLHPTNSDQIGNQAQIHPTAIANSRFPRDGLTAVNFAARLQPPFVTNFSPDTYRLTILPRLSEHGNQK